MQRFLYDNNNLRNFDKLKLKLQYFIIKIGDKFEIFLHKSPYCTCASPGHPQEKLSVKYHHPHISWWTQKNHQDVPETANARLIASLTLSSCSSPGNSGEDYTNWYWRNLKIFKITQSTQKSIRNYDYWT